MLKEIDTVRLPVWAIPYLEYGENDDMTDEEESLLREFLAGYDGYDGLVFNYQGEAYFSMSNELDGPAGETIDATIYGHPAEVDDDSRSYGPWGKPCEN